MTVESPIDRRFVFNGSAVAFGGRIRKPDDLFLKAAAVAHLPVTGGLSEAHLTGPDVSQYHYKDYLTFSEAHSRAQGDFCDTKRAAEYMGDNRGQNPLPVSTSVETQLLDLRIDAEPDAVEKTPRRLFEAKKLEIHMQTVSSPSAQESALRSFSVTFAGISLETGPKGASTPVELKVLTAPDIFCDNPTKAMLMEKYAKDGDFRKKYASCFHPLGEGEKGLISHMIGKHEIPDADEGPIVATFVTALEWVGTPPEGTAILNNRLTIAGLGRIYFGEIIIDDSYQRASLLRFELGSNVKGSGTAAEASSNGSHVPPLKP